MMTIEDQLGNLCTPGHKAASFIYLFTLGVEYGSARNFVAMH